MGPLGQIIIVVGVIVLFMVVVGFISRLNAQNYAKWLEEAEEKGFKPSSGEGEPVFDAYEIDLLRAMPLSSSGYSDSTQDQSEINLKPKLIARRKMNGQSESLFMYRSIGGRSSIQIAGTALLIRRESDFSMSWRMGRSGKTECDNSSKEALKVKVILEATDWKPVTCYAQEGILVGFEMTPRAGLFYVTGLGFECVLPLLDISESIIAELGKS
jgi:hypothetical protein